MAGVTSAGLSNIVPMCQCNSTTSFQIAGQPPFAQGEEPDAGERFVTPDFHKTLGIRIARGRGITAADREGAPPVVVVNETFERRYLPQGAIGRRLFLARGPAEIVGVLTDFNHDGPMSAPKPELYLALEQFPQSEMTLAVRNASGDPAQLLPGIRALVARIDADLPVFGQTTMQRVSGLIIGPLRLATRMMTVLAGMALILATVGIYGVASQLVAERRREIGIRIALGSDRAAVVTFIAWRGLRSVAFGAAGGLVAAAAVSVIVRSKMIGVDSFDPLTYVAVVAITLLSALGATVIPARRAARVDPLIALRSE